MHVCKFGSTYCGHFGVSSLCDYCKKKYELELAAEQNEISGQRALRQRQDSAASNAAFAEMVVEYPKTSLGIFLGILGGAALANHYSNKPEKKTPSIGSGKKKR